MSRIRADRYTNRAGTGAPTFSDGVNVVGITSVKAGAGVTTMEVTGDLSVISGTIKGASELSISGITSSISDTAVDVFVYDTSKDSDGGAWRKRTQNTSWYNETLNTATRGSRREFPAVAVLVLYDGGEALRIYDGDDPDLPMWMDFTNTSGRNYFYGSGQAQSITMLNGMFVTGAQDTNFWPILVDFLRDDCIGLRISVGNMWHGANIAGRNTSVTDSSVYWASSARRQNLWYINGYIINQKVNDIAMTVLPNAPIDSATGLPIPTIAVATDGGLSIINDDGTVSSPLTGNHIGSTIDISDYFVLYYGNESQGGYYPYDVSTASYISNGRLFSSNVDGPVCLLDNISNSANQTVRFGKNDEIAIGMDGGLNLISGNVKNSLPDIGMIAYSTSDYNTGYMQGDIKGAFLSDTDTGADFGPELVTGGDFSNASQWTLGTGWSINGSGQAEHTGSAGYIEQTGSFTGGRYYQMTADLVSGGSGSNFGMTNRNEPGVAQPHNQSTLVDVYCVGNPGGKIVAMWQQRSGVNLNTINLYANNSGTMVVDNVSIKEISRFYYDRSVNNKPLALFGSLTKSAVATGADLVAYSGFSNSNYLIQPYNSDLAPGTSEYSVVVWFKTGTSTSDQYIFDRTTDNAPRNLILIRGSAQSLPNCIQFYHNDASNNTSDLIASDFTVTDNVWHQVVGLFDGDRYRVYVDGKQSAISATPVRDVDNTDSPTLYVGVRNSLTAPMTGNLALFRYSKSAPSPEQIKKMYDDEKYLFQENSQATLYGSSDAVTALAFDDTTELLHVGTSAGRSEFQGLRRINNTTTAVTTALSASNELVAEQ